MRSKKTKVVFKLKQEGGYPPFSHEGLWAKDVDPEKGLYKIDNVPFYAYGVSLGDTVKTKTADDEVRFVKVVGKSGNSTLRVFCRDEGKIDALKELLAKKGGKVETSNIKKLFAVSVPKDKSIKDFLGYLEKNKEKYNCEVEDADVNHKD